MTRRGQGRKVQPSESAVIVSVPEAEDVVASLRATLDPSAAWGVPAHVTVLYPFLPPHRIDADVLAAVGDAVRSVPAFDAVLGEVRWFSDRVLWLAPEPAEPFRALTSAVWSRFPDFPPYSGEHLDVVPHLTVGDGDSLSSLRQAAEAVRPHLPIAVRVNAAHVIIGSPEPSSWRTVAELPLGRPPRDKSA